MEVCQNEKLKWEHDPQGKCFHPIQVLPNFHECFYNVWEHGGKCFLFFYEITRRKLKRGNSLLYSAYLFVFHSRSACAVLKPENMSSNAMKQHKYPNTLRLLFTLPSIAVSNYFSRCLDHCLRSFRSLFEYIFQ